MAERPGGALVRRPLHFFWLLDCSQSMLDSGKIDALNNAVRATIPALNDVARDNPHADLLVRALAFSQTVSWVIPNPTPVASLVWHDLEASGMTAMGQALREVGNAVVDLPHRALPPAIVLVSDGQPTDDFDGGLAHLMSSPWGQKAVRIAIGIGGDADLDVLRQFMNHPEMEPLTAGNPDELAHYLRWASTAASRIASQPIGPAVPPTNLPRFEPVGNADRLMTW